MMDRQKLMVAVAAALANSGAHAPHPKSSGVPWTGRKQRGQFMAYLPVEHGDRRVFPAVNKTDVRVYRVTASGNFVYMNKPQSRRDRHRQEVAARKLA